MGAMAIHASPSVVTSIRTDFRPVPAPAPFTRAPKVRVPAPDPKTPAI
jgi:hypothetical protein